MLVDNLNQGTLNRILARLDKLERGTPMNSSAVGRGGILVHGGGGITIENGGLVVTGTATITGTLQADGTIAFTGTLTQSGPSTFTGHTTMDGPVHINGATDINGATSVNGLTTVTGDFNVNGPMKTTGTLSVEGVTTLKNDLNVTAGGKIKVGNVNLTPTATDGGLEFISGGAVGANGGAVVVKGTGNAGLITSSNAALFAGATQMTISDGSLSVVGLPTVSGVTSNLYMDPSTKQVKRIV